MPEKTHMDNAAMARPKALDVATPFLMGTMDGRYRPLCSGCVIMGDSAEDVLGAVRGAFAA